MSESSYWNSHYSPSTTIDAMQDVEWYYNTYKGYMYTRLLQMFTYENLPETIPQEMLEYYLLSNGTCYIAEHDGELYAFQGSFGGEPDPYYRPTLYVVANPALNFSKSYKIKDDGVLMRNDRMWMGLDKLISRYAYLMATNVITIKVVDVILRCIALLSAPDDKSKRSAEEYLKQLEKGNLGVIGENPFFEGIKLQSPPSNNGSYLTQFIELHQYYKGSFYNEIGLNANFNMKREAIGKGEASLSQDSLLPLCDTMLECRKEDIKKINKKFGTNIKVDFASAWKENREESQLELEKLEAEASQLERSDEDGCNRGTEETEAGERDFGLDSEHSNDGTGRSEESGNTSQEEAEDFTDSGSENEPAGDFTDETSGNDVSEECITDFEENSETFSQEVNLVFNINTGEENTDAAEEEENSDNQGSDDTD